MKSERRTIHKTGQKPRSPHRLIQGLCLSVSVFALVLTGPGSQSLIEAGWHVPHAYAALPSGGDPFGDLEALPDQELENQRGGFRVGNIEVSVGVSVSTTIDGFVEVVSTFSINQPGELVSVGQTVQPVPQVAVPEVQVAAAPEVKVPDVPKVQVPDVPEVKVPNISIPTVQNANNGKSESNPPGQLDASIKQSADLALDTAREVFNSMEFKDKAKVTQNGAPPASGTAQPSPVDHSGNQAVDVAVTEINTGLDNAKNTISDALPSGSASSGTSRGNHQANSPGTQTLTATDAGASGKAASPSQTPSANADVVVSGPKPVNDTVETAIAAMDGAIEIVHQTKDGHLSIVRNSLNGISIRQNVSVDLTLENFSQIQSMSRVQRNLASIAQQMGVLSLRR
jgi:hypothetical protein